MHTDHFPGGVWGVGGRHLVPESKTLNKLYSTILFLTTYLSTYNFVGLPSTQNRLTDVALARLMRVSIEGRRF